MYLVWNLRTARLNRRGADIIQGTYSNSEYPSNFVGSSCKLRLPEISQENRAEFALGSAALQTETNTHSVVLAELHRIASSCSDNDSYMYGKLLEFLRVSSLDPNSAQIMNIKCPDPANQFSGMRSPRNGASWRHP